MKKLLIFLSAILLLAGCNDDLIERIEALENGSATLVQQTTSLQKSIEALESVDAEVKLSIADLSKLGKGHEDQISRLQEFDKTLQRGIDDLKVQLGKNLSDAKKWAEETFVTLDVYNQLIAELDALKAQFGENYKILDSKIVSSVSSIKEWANSALKAYYTSEQVDSKLDALKERLLVLETELNELLREFTITFNDSSIGIFPGETRTVNYSIKGATSKTTVKAIAQNGWSAKVIQKGNDKGEIVVTAPKPLVEDEIIVIVYDGKYRTIMSSVNFVKGVITPSRTLFEIPAKGGIVELDLKTNMCYQVDIPAENRSWISENPATKVMKTDHLVFTVSENKGASRQSTIKIKSLDTGWYATSFSIYQEGLLPAPVLFENIMARRKGNNLMIEGRARHFKYIDDKVTPVGVWYSKEKDMTQIELPGKCMQNSTIVGNVVNLSPGMYKVGLWVVKDGQKYYSDGVDLKDSADMNESTIDLSSKQNLYPSGATKLTQNLINGRIYTGVRIGVLRGGVQFSSGAIFLDNKQLGATGDITLDFYAISARNDSDLHIMIEGKGMVNGQHSVKLPIKSDPAYDGNDWTGKPDASNHYKVTLTGIMPETRIKLEAVTSVINLWGIRPSTKIAGN